MGGEVVCGGGGGCGSDGEVNVVSLSMAHHGMHRNRGHVSVDMTTRALCPCTGPQSLPCHKLISGLRAIRERSTRIHPELAPTANPRTNPDA